MANKWSAVESNEEHNSRREWLDGTGRPRASVTLRVKYDHRHSLVQDLYTSKLGPGRVVGTAGYNPRAYPVQSGRVAGAEFPWIIGVTSAVIRTTGEAGVAESGSEGQIQGYKSDALVDVQYGAQWNIEESIEFDTEVITQSYQGFKWASATTNKDQKFVRELEIPATYVYTAILTRKFIGLSSCKIDPVQASTDCRVILYPDLGTLMPSVGRVNTKAYTSRALNYTFKKGTLLMIEPDLKPSIDMQTFNTGGTSASGGEEGTINDFGRHGFSVTVKFLWKEGDPEGAEKDKRLNKGLKRLDTDTHNLFYRPQIQQTPAVGGDPKRGGWDRLEIWAGSNPEGHNEPGAFYEPYSPFREGEYVSPHWLIQSELPVEAS